MKQYINFEIRDRVISKENIIKLATIGYEEYCSDKDEFRRNFNDYYKSIPIEEYEDYYRGKFKITLNCSDGSRYSSDSLDIITKSDLIDYKKINSITIDFESNEYNKMLGIYLIEGSHISSYFNKVEIKGDDEKWVNALTQQIKDIIEHIKPQLNFLSGSRKIFPWIASILLSTLSLFTFVMFVALLVKLGILNGEINKPSIQDNSWILSIAMYIIGFTLVWKIWIDDKIKKLWPRIEFSFGPKHFQNGKIKRKILSTFVTLILLPIIFLILGKI
ncbi:MAG: hypothetical protein LKI07_12745 [Heyndrickxia oleronia]|jgi:hypothetical protein|nr:hypothetical protein [Heyndrickxia oleronia]